VKKPIKYVRVNSGPDKKNRLKKLAVSSPCLWVKILFMMKIRAVVTGSLLG
jgi:hypothetical protein